MSGGAPLRILFVCSRNQWRSPTAEAVYRQVPGLAVRSGGTSPRARHPVSAGDVAWADLICVMEDQHRTRLQAAFPAACSRKRLVVLHIPDDYRYMDPELVAELRAAVDPLLTTES